MTSEDFDASFAILNELSKRYILTKRTRVMLGNKVSAVQRMHARHRLLAEGKSIEKGKVTITKEDIANSEPDTRLLRKLQDTAKEEELRQFEAIESLLLNDPVFAPIIAFPESVKGFGLGMLAQILAAAGNLSNYRNESCLWKRMGVGMLHDGENFVAQRRYKNAELAEKAGFNPERRAIMYVVSNRLILAKGAMYDLYVAKKEKLKEAHPEQTPKHIDMQANRYIAIKLLRKLYRYWNQCYSKEGEFFTPPKLIKEPVRKRTKIDAMKLAAD